MIHKEDLKIGAAYKGEGRNFNVAIWTGDKFAGLRYKYGEYFMDEEYHWDDEAPFGTFKPLWGLG
jgi:hypothetical protein